VDRVAKDAACTKRKKMPRISLVNRTATALRDAGVDPEERLLVAVSGGMDSMALLDVLVRLRDRLGLRLHVAHVHHGLRGEAADQDAAFVVAEAARRGVATSVGRLDPAERRRGESVEMWARSARYACLDAIAARVRASRIAVAHTLDDQAETVLLHLLRGTGPRGLAGIPPTRHRILRPLLAVSRGEIETYTAARHLTFRTDASNVSDAYLRNRVRHALLPLLAKKYNPRIAESLAALAALMREDESALEAQAASLLAEAARAIGSSVYLTVEALRAAPPAVLRRAFQEAFRRTRPEGTRDRHGLTRRHLDALRRLLTREGGVRLPGGAEARREGSVIRMGPSAAPVPGAAGKDSPPLTMPFSEVPIRPGVWTRWPPLDCRLRVRRVGADTPLDHRARWRAVLAPRVLEGRLALRGWRPGDRFRPLGMSGEKKLQDYFVDAKVPRQERARIPLLLVGGRIAWVVGQRVAEGFRFRGGGPACLVEVEFPGKRRQPATDNRKPTTGDPSCSGG
jgi:tRNA(Ile)-lysidine synthase